MKCYYFCQKCQVVGHICDESKTKKPKSVVNHRQHVVKNKAVAIPIVAD